MKETSPSELGVGLNSVRLYTSADCSESVEKTLAWKAKAALVVRRLKILAWRRLGFQNYLVRRGEAVLEVLAGWPFVLWSDLNGGDRPRAAPRI